LIAYSRWDSVAGEPRGHDLVPSSLGHTMNSDFGGFLPALAVASL